MSSFLDSEVPRTLKMTISRRSFLAAAAGASMAAALGGLHVSEVVDEEPPTPIDLAVGEAASEAQGLLAGSLRDAAAWAEVERIFYRRMLQCWRDDHLRSDHWGAFAVKCDAEMNPPETVAAKEVWVRVIACPSAASESILVYRIGISGRGNTVSSERWEGCS